MSGFVFGSRFRTSVSTFAVAALLAAAPALAAGNASTASGDSSTPVTKAAPAAPAVQAPAAQAPASQAPAPQATGAGAAAASTTPKALPTQVATTPKADHHKTEVTKTQADAVAKELGAKPSDTLAVQLGKYAEQMHAAAALKDTAQRGKAVTEARQQLSSIAGKPVTPEQAAKVDSLLGLPAAQPATVQ